MNDREHRLRQRIDTLTDQRDHALELAHTRGQKLKQATSRIYQLTRSRDLWRQHALKGRPTWTRRG